MRCTRELGLQESAIAGLEEGYQRREQGWPGLLALSTDSEGLPWELSKLMSEVVRHRGSVSVACGCDCERGPCPCARRKLLACEEREMSDGGNA